MDIERIKITLENLIERSENPLYNPLEGGFRHSPLTIPETIRRYKDFSDEVNVYCKSILNEISSLKGYENDREKNTQKS